MLINENYKIESDEMNVTLHYLPPGTKTWRPIAYFSTPQNALDYLVEKEIMGTGMADLKTVCQKINELQGLISKLQGLPNLLELAPRQRKNKNKGIVPIGVLQQGEMIPA